MKTFTYLSLGCKVNSYESSALADSLIKEGYVYSESNPDVAFINTCSVTKTADQKSRQHIRKLMNKYPNAIIVVMGCYSQGEHEYISREIKPHIIVGANHRKDIPSLIKQYEQTGERIDLVKDNPRSFDYEELGTVNYQENVRAYLKIEDGCNNFCSYCVIPFRRGKARSRAKQDIIKEAKDLLSKGYKEIVLTGINVSYYGQDLENESFYKLVKELLELPNLYRLRISSIEDSEVEPELISLLDNPKLASHMHIPLQSGSDTVLKRMNRKYTSDDFYKKIELIHKINPLAAVTTDVIVGFPGESEEEFMETYHFIEKCNFAMLHVFPFSPREGTLASKMKDQIDPKIKKERCLKLIELSNRLWDKYISNFVNKEVEVLIEQYDEEHHYNIGHTSNYLEVHIPGERLEVGSIVKTIYKK